MIRIRNENSWMPVVALLLPILMSLLSTPVALAEGKYKVLYNFTYPRDGVGEPAGDLIFDQAGNLYGTTIDGGPDLMGSVFQLTPKRYGQWNENVLYNFTGGSDGSWPVSGLIFDAAGNLYGTTSGGNSYVQGTVFKLTQNGGGSWAKSVLHSFTGGTDGSNPSADLTFDSAGNLYGTTAQGGTKNNYCAGNGCGAVFQLTPNGDGTWTEHTLYSFSGPDGQWSYSRLIFDAGGNLYGTTSFGGDNAVGTVFTLTPNGGGNWTESVLYSFTGGNDGAEPLAGLIFDAGENLYGTASAGGDHGIGVVFKLTPNGGGKWTESVLHSFTGSDGAKPAADLVFDTKGGLYGTTLAGGDFKYCGGEGCGVVFQLQPNGQGGWRMIVQHTFLNYPAAAPAARVIFDTTGNLYGTAEDRNGRVVGTVFRITP
jgi:uncharacterized repeat protein (TIGR03803 family)